MSANDRNPAHAAGYRQALSDRPPIVRRPTHLAGVLDGKRLALFIDGQLQLPAVMLEGDFVPSSLNFAVGGGASINSSAHNLFAGEIDELRFSHVARYDKDFVPPERDDRFTPDGDTLALYHFDEGAGDVLRDSSGNNHHGKIVGAKWAKRVAAATPPQAVAPFDAAQAKKHQQVWARHLGTTVETVNSVGQKMVLIPPGEFLMGSTDEQVEAALKVAEEIKTDPPTKDRIQKSERPQHKVVITKPFLMSATEVTVGQFQKFAAATSYQTEAEKAAQDAKTGTYLAAASDDLPAAYITWNDATAYCQWLSSQEKSTYRLPTEAEWEYACRSGTTTQYSFGDDVALFGNYGRSRENADGNKSQPVGTLLPNPFGLFDMHGNLNEWCGDHFDEKWYSVSTPNDPIGPTAGPKRVVRGGNWNSDASNSRSATRNYDAPSHRNNLFGFRCVRELDAPATTASVTPTNSAAVVLSPAEAARHRAAAEFVLKKGGGVGIKPDREASLNTWRLTDLPAGSFAVTHFSLRKFDIDQLLDVRDEELEAVAGLSQVDNCNFDCNQLSDAAIDIIATLPALNHLGLIRAKFSADGLARLKALPKLTRLDFNETNFTGMLSRFHELPKVWHLTFSLGCRLSPADIEALAAAKPLRMLVLNQVPLGDDHVAALSKLTQIRSLDLAGTEVTAPGVERLVAALPKCEITSEHAVAGASIRLTSLIDPIRDAVSVPDVTGANRWFVNPSGMNFGSDGKSGKLRLPVDVAGRDYQLFMHIEHRSGTPQVEVEVPLAGGVKSLRFAPGHREIRVTKTGTEVEISDTADGPLKLRWRGDPTKSDGLIPYQQTRTDPKSIGLAVHGGSVQFYAVSLKFLDKPAATAGNAPRETDPERRVAQWVLARGGSVGVTSSGSSKGASRLEDLPAGPIVVTSINLNSAKGITPQEWQSLAELRFLTGLSLLNCSVDDAALASIGRIETLILLVLINGPKPEEAARITDAGVRHLAGLRRLEGLDFKSTAMTAQSLDAIGLLNRLMSLKLGYHSKLHIESLAPLRGLTRVEILELDNTHLSDTALADLPVLPRVRSLAIGNNNVTDAGLAHLNACRELRWLSLRGTPVTAAGVRQLAEHAALKLTHLWETRITPAELPALADQFPRTMLVHPALKSRYAPELDAYTWIKSVGGTTGYSYTEALESGGTFHPWVNVTFDKAIPDSQELRKLADVKFLNSLQFAFSNNSDATIRLALESLRDQPTLTQFVPGTTAITPATMRELARHQALSSLVMFGDDKVGGATAEALELLPTLPRIRQLRVASPAVTNKVWTHLAQLRELRHLEFSGSQLTGQGLGELRAVPELRSLKLPKLKLVPADLTPLAEFPELMHLQLDSSTLDDAGLANLAGCRTLRIVEARSTKVTAAGVAKLQQAIPKCTVFWDDMLNVPRIR